MASELKFAVLGPVRAWRGETELDLGPRSSALCCTRLSAHEWTRIPTVIFCPGDIGLMHQTDERVLVQDIAGASRVFSTGGGTSSVPCEIHYEIH